MQYFSEIELSCPCCGVNNFDQITLEKLNNLRHECGFPFIVSSAYRCKAYNQRKGFTQTHATGRAIDIVASHNKSYDILTKARKYGFTGIGVSQKGEPSKRFIHLDDLPNSASRPRPHVWSY